MIREQICKLCKNAFIGYHTTKFLRIEVNY